MIAAGVTTAYCDGLKYLQKNLVEYKVSVFFCVPLLIESIYKKVMQNVKKQGKEKKIVIFKYKQKTGSTRRKQGHRQPYTKLTVEKIG